MQALGRDHTGPMGDWEKSHTGTVYYPEQKSAQGKKTSLIIQIPSCANKKVLSWPPMSYLEGTKILTSFCMRLKIEDSSLGIIHYVRLMWP